MNNAQKALEALDKASIEFASDPGWFNVNLITGETLDTIRNSLRIMAGKDETFVVRRREPSKAALDAGVKHAMSISLTGEYRWPDYMRDLYLAMTAAQATKED